MPTVAVVRLVRSRAAGRCEYCRFPQAASRFTFPVDHVIAKQHGGGDEPGNLATACLFCNTSKGPNVAGIDHRFNRLVWLYNPRRHRWADHFAWAGAEIVGRTTIGRVTIAVLATNRFSQLQRRRQLAVDGAVTFADDPATGE